MQNLKIINLYAFSGNGKMKYIDLKNLIEELSKEEVDYVHGSRYYQIQVLILLY